MKNIKRIMMGAVICFTALMTVISPMADNVTEGTTSATVTIGLGSIKSTEGTLTVTDNNGILDGAPTFEAYLGSAPQTINGDRVYMFTGGDAEAAKIVVNATLKSDAPVGACVYFNYEGGYTDTSDNYSATGKTGSASICVVAKPVTPTPTPTPTPSKPGTGVKVNYSALFAQVNAAEALAVTENSFLLDVTLSFAKNQMASKSQFVVDFVANLLEAVINGVK